MREIEVLIIGAGPAGLAAAIECSRAGLHAVIVEQRETIGGAIYRQPVHGVTSIPQPRTVKARRRRLLQNFDECGVIVRHGSVFLGVDGDGLAMVENRSDGTVEHVCAKAVIIATGAVEKILPRPGWQMAGVSTAGGLQVMMKETGKAPAGRVLLAGSGPLLLAVASQMAKAGNPPVAIVEAGDPLRHPLMGVKFAAFPDLLAEAVFYLKDVWLKGIPWLRGTTVTSIRRETEVLLVTLRDRKGAERHIVVDRIGLHDGIRPNDFGLPETTLEQGSAPLIVTAGDCREALGALAAEADGRRAAQRILRILKVGQVRAVSVEIDRHAKAQALLAGLFAPVADNPLFSQLSDDTVLCRCENRTFADLKNLCGRPDPLSGREVKHNGRFAMGACQGRFCAENTARLMAELRPDTAPPSPNDLTGRRWPIRPVSIGAMVRASQDRTQQE